MKRILVILFLFLHSISFAQISDETKDSIFISAQNKYPNLFIESLCSHYFELAEQKVKRDSLILPQFKLNPWSTETYKRLLKKNYNIIDWTYASGCVIRPEVACFDDYMFTAIEAKYGKGFLNRQSVIADSLDNVGLGFIDSKYKGSDTALRAHINQFVNIDSINLSRPSSKAILFYLDKNGKLTHLDLFEGSIMMRVVEKTDKLYLELLKIFKKSPKWIPAKFLGEHIESTYLFEFR